MKRQLRNIAILITCIFLLSTFTFAQNQARCRSLERAVKIWSVKLNQFILELIARHNDDNRAAGTEGYNVSARYVKKRLRMAGYNVQEQEFDFAYFEELSDPEMEQTSPGSVTYPPNVAEGFMTMSYSGPGDVTAIIQPVDVVMPPGVDPNTSTSGCEIEDFADFVPGNIALIQRGSCSFFQKAINAQDSGAVGVIVFNEGQEGRINALRGTLGGPDLTIPVVFANYNIGEELYNLTLSGDVQVHLNVDAVSEIRPTYNIIADTRRGDDTNTIVVGAHLDSVLAGPGINDNGSGSAAILEVAIKMARLRIRPKNKVRFAFWGAEEAGLNGSEYYVSNLAPEELDKIALNLNIDMIASENYVRFVYDGDGSDTSTPGPEGSGSIEQAFIDYFDSKGLETEPTALDGRSDYASFMDVGVPIGGLFTGAGGIKTEEEAAIYGGTAGEPYDAYYHTIDDTMENCNYTVENQMLKAIAHMVQKYAMETFPTVRAEEKALRSMAIQEKAAEFEYRGPYAVR